MNHTDYLKEKARQLPELPGIYKMLDFRKNIIYVGKSKCLKKRVQSYFTASPKWDKVTRMVTAIRDIDYIVTDTHLEARLLECRLIKEYRPRFNAQMKNDGSYFFIKVEDHLSHRPLSVVSERDTDCFGPFRSKFTISELLNRMKNLYPITQGKDCYKFDYHLFPVTLDKSTFEQNRQILLDIFSSEHKLLMLIETITAKMEEAVAGYQYELAAIYRDMIHGLKIIKNGLDGYQSLASKQILLKLPTKDGYKLFYVDKGKGSIIHSLKLPALSEEAIREFIRVSKTLSVKDIPAPDTEKSYIDYRDVLYSEISSLSEEDYELL